MIGKHLATFNLFREADHSLQITIAEAQGVRSELGDSGAPLALCTMNALYAAVDSRRGKPSHPHQADREAIARCIEIVRETRDGFLSEEYAVDQPMSSFLERFACDQAATAIENEFGMGTDEQRRLLGKPTPIEQYRASLALSPTPSAGRDGSGIPTGEGFDADGSCMVCNGDCAGANPPVMNCPLDDKCSEREALSMFVRAAYPVATEINPRGYNWSEAYLDEALAHAAPPEGDAK